MIYGRKMHILGRVPEFLSCHLTQSTSAKRIDFALSQLLLRLQPSSLFHITWNSQWEVCLSLFVQLYLSAHVMLKCDTESGTPPFSLISCRSDRQNAGIHVSGPKTFLQGRIQASLVWTSTRSPGSWSGIVNAAFPHNDVSDSAPLTHQCSNLALPSLPFCLYFLPSPIQGMEGEGSTVEASRQMEMGTLPTNLQP